MFSFKRDSSVYIVYNGYQYNIDISDVSFGQNIQETPYSNKTLQSVNHFEQSSIVKVAPAFFDITFPALREADFQVIFNRILDANSFDLYITNLSDVFKIETSCITNAIFNINKTSPLSITISGQGAKLTREGNYGVYTIPGTPQTRSSSRTYNKIQYVDVTLDGSLFESVFGLSIEIQNNIKWNENTNVVGCSTISSLQYPSTYTVEKKVLSGSFSAGVIDDFDTSTTSTLQIEVGQKLGQTLYGFNFNLPKVSYTSRLSTGDIFLHNYDWRLIQSPTSLLEYVTYVTESVGDANAILDSWNQAILDSLNNPILHSI